MGSPRPSLEKLTGGVQKIPHWCLTLARSRTITASKPILFPFLIPVEDYHVCRQLTLGKTGDILAKTQAIGKPGSGEHDHKTFELNSIHGPVKGTIGTPASGQPDPPDPPQNSAGSGGPEGAHQHHVLIPEKMRRLKPGDRVLVAWVQSEAVVVDIICPRRI